LDLTTDRLADGQPFVVVRDGRPVGILVDVGSWHFP